MGLAAVPGHLKRYKDIAWLLVKYGRSDLLRGTRLDAELRPGSPAGDASATAEDLAKDLEKLGPTFVKIGQLLSTRADLFPPEYLAQLARLQDQVEPFPFSEVERIVSAELSVRISKAFSSFDPTPIAAASLGQVHRAVLRDGRLVAVKVQRPGIREQVVEDLDAFAGMADLLEEHSDVGERYELSRTVEEFRRMILAELDYLREANNLAAMRESLAEFDRIVVPAPVEDYTTSRVLTMEFVDAEKLTALNPVARLDLDTRALAEQLFRAYLKQILLDGFFHADPHPGNVLVTRDGRLAVVDLGMVARIAPELQENLLKLLLAVSDGEGERAARVATQIGRRRESFDPGEFERHIVELVGAYRGATVGEIQVGRVLLEVSRASAESGLRLPPELALLGKTLLNLDEIGRTLDPDFDPNAAIRKNAGDLLRRRMMKSASPANVAANLLEAKEFVEKLPGRVNRVLDLMAENHLRIGVDALDETVLIEGLQKIANRIAMGLVLAALIVGAALLIQVPTSFRIFGYPGLAMLFFLAAAAGGFGLIFAILSGDRTKKAKTGPRSPR
jgi:predicted unusual protein kinase regulating ubiquinone biosynthesis (AarF/ABC1/UbiB family)